MHPSERLQNSHLRSNNRQHRPQQLWSQPAQQGLPQRERANVDHCESSRRCHHCQPAIAHKRNALRLFRICTLLLTTLLGEASIGAAAELELEFAEPAAPAAPVFDSWDPTGEFCTIDCCLAGGGAEEAPATNRCRDLASLSCEEHMGEPRIARLSLTTFPKFSVGC
jgi:hypothetical protein